MTEIAALPPIGKGEELHEIEAPRKIITHYNRTPQSLKGFDEAGYFIFQNVKVFEQGKRHKRDSLSVEQVVFGEKSAR